MTDDQFNLSSHKRLIELSDEISKLSLRIAHNTELLRSRPDLNEENQTLIKQCSHLLRDLQELQSGHVRKPGDKRERMPTPSSWTRKGDSGGGGAQP